MMLQSPFSITKFFCSSPWKMKTETNTTPIRSFCFLQKVIDKDYTGVKSLRGRIALFAKISLSCCCFTSHSHLCLM